MAEEEPPTEAVPKTTEGEGVEAVAADEEVGDQANALLRAVGEEEGGGGGDPEPEMVETVSPPTEVDPNGALSGVEPSQPTPAVDDEKDLVGHDTEPEDVDEVGKDVSPRLGGETESEKPKAGLTKGKSRVQFAEKVEHHQFPSTPLHGSLSSDMRTVIPDGDDTGDDTGDGNDENVPPFQLMDSPNKRLELAESPRRETPVYLSSVTDESNSSPVSEPSKQSAGVPSLPLTKETIVEGLHEDDAFSSDGGNSQDDLIEDTWDIRRINSCAVGRWYQAPTVKKDIKDGKISWPVEPPLLAPRVRVAPPVNWPDCYKPNYRPQGRRVSLFGGSKSPKTPTTPKSARGLETPRPAKSKKEKIKELFTGSCKQASTEKTVSAIVRAGMAESKDSLNLSYQDLGHPYQYGDFTAMMRSVRTIHTLVLTNCHLKTLRGLRFPSIIILHLDQNRFTSIRDLPMCPQLVDLSLQFNEITAPRGLQAFPELQVLHLAHNPLAAQKAYRRILGLAAPPKLRVLDDVALEHVKPMNGKEKFFSLRQRVGTWKLRKSKVHHKHKRQESEVSSIMSKRSQGSMVFASGEILDSISGTSQPTMSHPKGLLDSDDDDVEEFDWGV